MHKHQNHNKFLDLRQKYSFFVFQSYDIHRTKNSLSVKFYFNLADQYSFQPRLEIPARDFYDFDKMDDDTVDLLVFYIGMVELISYWKAACPPRVIVEPHALDREQVDWWKKLYFNGLGEFFYLNGINISQNDFMTISGRGSTTKPSSAILDQKKVLVPIGGGKDSVVSMEILKNSDFQIRPFILNPRAASLRTIEIGGFDEEHSAIVNRRLDKKLLELNDMDFLNGHTPFSALLAFVTSLIALATGSKYIALSNENSANEATVPGSKINHQYSKSLEFEEDFAWYTKKYIHKDIYYFSFLRPLNELQIAAFFSTFPQHFFSFRSCNVGSKTDSWCGHCPKCLFTYVILSPFIPSETLKNIFGKNLLEDESLKHIMKELNGDVEVKPFECVGTPEEVNAALWSFGSKLQNGVPKLLDVKKTDDQSCTFNRLLKNRQAEHRLPKKFYGVMQKALDKLIEVELLKS